MKAAVFHAPGDLAIQQVELDSPWPREVVVRTAAVGVCHSDLHFVEGVLPMSDPTVLGHEPAGIVEEVGDQVTYLKPGDHVVACVSVFCGECSYCLTGRPYLCQSEIVRRGPDAPPRLTLDGQPVNQFTGLSAFAERMLIHERSLVKIESEIPLDIACLVGCGVLTGVGAVLRTAQVEAGSRVVVVGCGGVGLSVVQGAVIAGASRIIAVDLLDNKLEMARRFGATDVVNSSRVDPVETILEMTDGGVEYSFEAIGKAKTAEQAFGMVARGGMTTTIGVFPPGEKIAVEGSWLYMDRQLRASRMGGNTFRIDIPRYLDFWRHGRLKLEEMVSRRAPLEGINEAFRALKAGEVARTVLVLDPSAVRPYETQAAVTAQAG